MDPKELRRSYNHHCWRSPVAKIVVKNNHWDIDSNGNKIKRITHEQALTILAKRCRKTIKEFLLMSASDSWDALEFVVYRYGIRRTYNPLYPPLKYKYSKW